MRKIFLLVCAIMIFVSCENSSIGNVELNENNKRKWTTIVYMAADNNLESAGIDDLKELESVNLNGSKMTVLVLLDRADGYDERIGNWTDTRLFEVKYDSKFDKRTIASKRLDCKELGLSASEETELDMGKIETLSGVIDFAKRKYEAEHYALVMWGHGNGWRGMCEEGQENGENLRAMATDSHSNNYITVSQFRKAVEDKNLDLIFFDTCFGATIENLYELKEIDCAVIGSPGATPEKGLDYGRFLSLYKKSDKSIEAVSECISKSAAVVTTKVDTKKISTIGTAINDFAFALAEYITDVDIRDEVYDQLFLRTKKYTTETFPSEMFLDVYSMAQFYSSSEDENVAEKAEALSQILKSSLHSSCEHPAIGIYFVTLIQKDVPSSSHPSLYCHDDENDSSSFSKSLFVHDVDCWVPTDCKKSLLDKLFYEKF